MLQPFNYFSTRTFFASIASWLVLAMLGQSLLPSFAYARAAYNPEFWNEICSVAGVRRKGAETRSEASTDTNAKSTNVPMQHADCPLCLHLGGDIILDTPALSASMHLLFLNAIIEPQSSYFLFLLRSLKPEARGPPAFN